MNRLTRWRQNWPIRRTRRLARQMWGSDAPRDFDEIVRRAIAENVVSEQDLYDAAALGIEKRNKLTRM